MARFPTDLIHEWFNHPCSKQLFDELKELELEAVRDMEEYVAQEKFYKSSQVLGYSNAICDIKDIPNEWTGEETDD